MTSSQALKNIGNQLNRSARVCRPVSEPVAAARRLCRCAVIDYCPEDPQTRSGRIYDRNSQRGRADDGKWTLARAITSHHPYRWIPSRPRSDVFGCPLDASGDCGGGPDDSGTLNFQCPPLSVTSSHHWPLSYFSFRLARNAAGISGRAPLRDPGSG